MTTLTVTVTDSQGNQTVQTHDFQTGGSETILTGDISTTVAAGTVARLRGNVKLLADLHVRGELRADPTGVVLDGNNNQFNIHTHDGGVLNLVGVEKSGWVFWGDTPTGWQTGDRLAVSPTKPGVYVPTETTWQGSWAATSRPANSPDVTLVDGSTARPEVANLSQTLTFKNLDRMMMHESAVPNVHTLKWFKVLNSGRSLVETGGELGHYPVHFHLLGDTCRGSVVEGVVVEGGKLHAFVPHGSHGITFTDCVAYNTTDDAYWWDFPQGSEGAANNTNDVVYDHCLALWVKVSPEQDNTLGGFVLGAGDGNSIVNSAASCVQGGADASGYHWPSQANQDPNVWIFTGNVVHNNNTDGTFSWQNDPKNHVIENLTVYNVGGAGIDHGAYRNKYLYRNITITGCDPSIQLLANSHLKAGPLIFEDILTDGGLRLADHHQISPVFTIIRRVTFTGVVYEEGKPGHPGLPSRIKFEDCGLTPTDFVLAGAVFFIHPDSIIEIWEGGQLQHRWAGSWT